MPQFNDRANRQARIRELLTNFGTKATVEIVKELNELDTPSSDSNNEVLSFIYGQISLLILLGICLMFFSSKIQSANRYLKEAVTPRLDLQIHVTA